jgi:hypothetical protein
MKTGYREQINPINSMKAHAQWEGQTNFFYWHTVPNRDEIAKLIDTITRDRAGRCPLAKTLILLVPTLALEDSYFFSSYQGGKFCECGFVHTRFENLYNRS